MMAKIVSVLFELTDDLNLKACHIEYNDTGIPEKELIEGIANAILTNKNIEDVMMETTKILQQ